MLRSIPCDYGGSIAGNLHIECSVERDAARSPVAAALYGRVCVITAIGSPGDDDDDDDDDGKKRKAMRIFLVYSEG